MNVSITGDALDEEDEYLWLSLAAPVNATLADDLGKGTVADDDAAPSLSVSDVTVDEGGAGTTSYRSVYARLSAPSGRTVTVSWATANGMATAGEDYLAGQGTLTFQPGEIEKFLVVGVRGDDVVEPDETFVAALSNPSWAILADPSGLVTIRNDD